VPGSLAGPVARTRSPTLRCIRQSNTAATARSNASGPEPTTTERSTWS
jgi:hypothetical protein